MKPIYTEDLPGFRIDFSKLKEPHHIEDLLFAAEIAHDLMNALDTWPYGNAVLKIVSPYSTQGFTYIKTDIAHLDKDTNVPLLHIVKPTLALPIIDIYPDGKNGEIIARDIAYIAVNSSRCLEMYVVGPQGELVAEF